MSSQKNTDLPRMVLADPQGRIFDHPTLCMAAQSGTKKLRGDVEELVPLAEGGQLFSLPGRYPVGWDPTSGEFVTVRETTIDGQTVECTAVAAFLPPGYLRFLLPATEMKKRHPILPLWAYGAVGWWKEGFCSSGVYLDPNPHWHPRFFRDDEELARLVQALTLQHPDNRLLDHLSHCALTYHCFAAKNVFYRRWEAPLPASPGCNADCLGCLSYQPWDGCQASHERISFVPNVDEIVEVALPHMEEAEAPIVSFGQGCEGEPLLEGDLLEKTIATLREKTSKGTINVNTNGSLPRIVERLVDAGLDSIRITLAAATPAQYVRYHRPGGYNFSDVIESIGRAKARGIHVAINLLVFPGFTDREDEINALTRLIHTTGIDMIQMRNLNIDPDWYLKSMETGETRGVGLSRMLCHLRESFPDLTIGYFNQTKESFSQL
jgi:pyruvate-formate lyase-activating enzyme